MQQVGFVIATLVLGGALAAGTVALSALLISTGLRDGRQSPERRAVAAGISLLIGMVQAGYVALATPAVSSAGGVLGVMGGVLLIGAGAGALAFLLALAIHGARAGADRRAREAEAQYRMAMSIYTMQLEAWARVASSPRGEPQPS